MLVVIVLHHHDLLGFSLVKRLRCLTKQINLISLVTTAEGALENNEGKKICLSRAPATGSGRPRLGGTSSLAGVERVLSGSRAAPRQH